MLREDVIRAVEEGKFHIYPVERIDEGIEILTGVPAGELNQAGKYPEDSVNGKVHARLADLAEKRLKYSAPTARGERGMSHE
jgi:predicted ATP-dependent protease